MKETRFIELVNLYIDRQITAEEMGALEAELQANSRRRSTYRQYCRMHRATTQVYESFRTGEAVAVSNAAAGDARVSRFEPGKRLRRTPWLYYSCGMAAACIALVFARINYSDSPIGRNAADLALSSPEGAPAAVARTAVVPAPIERIDRRAVSAGGRADILVTEQDYAAMLAAMRQVEQRAFASGHSQPGPAASLFEDGVFDSRSPDGARTFRSQQSSSASQTEFAAFQFQR